MATKTRRTAAEVNALTKEAIQRKAEVEADKRAQPAPRKEVAPTPTPQPIVREIISGMRPGPVYGQVIPIDERSYRFNSRVDMQSGPGLIQLQIASNPDGPWFPLEPGQNAAGNLNGWTWRKYLRWEVRPQTRKEFTCAVEVEFQYDSDTYDTTHKPRYNPEIRAFELVTA